MPAKPPIPDETRAAILAAWNLGTSKAKIARDFGVSRTFVIQLCKEQIGAAANRAEGPVAVTVYDTEKKKDLGEVVYELTFELAAGATAIARQFQDPVWLAAQSADGLHLSLGVAIDKLAGLLGAIQRGQRTSQD